MKHKIDPTVDCVFKAVLGQEENTPLLMHFLNAVLRLEGDARITAVTLLNPYNEKEFETDKLSVVDVKALSAQGVSYQIEIQRAIHAGLTSRILYTWSAIYHALLKEGEPYSQLAPVISIWLLKDNLFPQVNAYHLAFAPYSLEHGLRLSEHLAIHLLQLPKWQLREKGLDETDRWMYFFNEGQEVDLDHLPDILNTKEMRQAMKVLERFSENQKNYLLYEQRLDAERVELTWKAMLEHERQEKEHERQEKERERQEKERERQEKEHERQEKERLLALLRKAGIDPQQP